VRTNRTGGCLNFLPHLPFHDVLERPSAVLDLDDLRVVDGEGVDLASDSTAQTPTTMRYAHLADAQLVDAVKALEVA
jgi:hypothetical protein